MEKKNASKKKAKKIAKLCVGAVVLILVAVIAFNVISMFTGYNGLLRKVMTAYEKYDIDTLVELSSDMYFYADEDYADSYFENQVGYALDYFESDVGHSYKLSYEVNEIYTLSKRNMETLLDDIIWMFPDFGLDTIEEIAVAEVIVTAEQGSKSVTKNLKITMTKEAGTWKLLYIG